MILAPTENRKSIIRKENERIERCERQYPSLVRHAANCRPYLPRRARMFPLYPKSGQVQGNRSKKLTKKRAKKKAPSNDEPSKKPRLPDHVATVEAAYTDPPQIRATEITKCREDKRNISTLESYFMWLGTVRGSLRRGSPAIRQDPILEQSAVANHSSLQNAKM